MVHLHIALPLPIVIELKADRLILGKGFNLFPFKRGDLTFAGCRLAFPIYQYTTFPKRLSSRPKAFVK